MDTSERYSLFVTNTKDTTDGSLNYEDAMSGVEELKLIFFV